MRITRSPGLAHRAPPPARACGDDHPLAGAALRWVWDGPESPGDAISLGARILKAALDYDALIYCGESPQSAVGMTLARARWYDSRVLGGLKAQVAGGQAEA
jgi:hypothetical protein